MNTPASWSWLMSPGSTGVVMPPQCMRFVVCPLCVPAPGNSWR